MVEKEVPKEAKESKEPPLEDEVCDPLDSNLEESFDDLDDLIGIIRPLMVSTSEVPKRNEDVNHKGKIFQTRVNCERQVCSLVIDTGSCTNVVYPKKLSRS